MRSEKSRRVSLFTDSTPRLWIATLKWKRHGRGAAEVSSIIPALAPLLSVRTSLH